MKYSFTEEQEEFRSILRRFFEDKSPTSEVRRLMATEDGWERERWFEINSEMGLTALAIPEKYGGQGFGTSEQCIVLEEMGRALLCAPYFSTAVLAASSVLYAGKEQDKEYLLPEIASGRLIATLAFKEEKSSWDPASVTTTAKRQGGTYFLEGTKNYVVDGHTADLILVLARAPESSGADELSLFFVEKNSLGLDKQPLTSLDETRKLAKLSFKDVPAKLLGEEGSAGKIMERILINATICLSNEMIGGADRLREDALEYVKMRMQFGRSIASFQVTKHKAADMLADVELAKSAAYYAAAAFDDGDEDVESVASLAKAAASETYIQTAIQAIQMHGGIGFTWDNNTHLWFKRAKSSEVFLGDANYHRERMLQHWTPDGDSQNEQ